MGKPFVHRTEHFAHRTEDNLQVHEANFTLQKKFVRLIENFPHLKELTAHLQILFFYLQEFSVRKRKNETARMVHSRRLLLNKLLPDNTFISGSFYKIHAVCEGANADVYR